MSTRIRIALFNIQELSKAKLFEAEGGVGRNEQLIAAARIVQRIRPDILAINEIDQDVEGESETPKNREAKNLRRFVELYLRQGAAPIDFEHAFAAPCNTGYSSGFDLSGDGRVSSPADRGTHEYALDCWGYGHYPGHYAMGLLSRFPIDWGACRTFRRFLWCDLPGHHLAAEYLPEGAREIFPLSSKSHWDVAIPVGGRALHVLMCHPTPRGFDGPGTRNWARNFDEIMFWRRYIDGATELIGDEGRRGGLAPGEAFVIAGDLNAEPEQDARWLDFDGTTAIGQLLEHPRIQDTGPLLTSRGALRGRAPGAPSFPERNTLPYQEAGSRFDYLLPSNDIRVVDGGVYWPDAQEDPEGAALADVASDHRLLWLDLELS